MFLELDEWVNCLSVLKPAPGCNARTEQFRSFLVVKRILVSKLDLVLARLEAIALPPQAGLSSSDLSMKLLQMIKCSELVALLCPHLVTLRKFPLPKLQRLFAICLGISLTVARVAGHQTQAVKIIDPELAFGLASYHNLRMLAEVLSRHPRLKPDLEMPVLCCHIEPTPDPRVGGVKMYSTKAFQLLECIRPSRVDAKKADCQIQPLIILKLALGVAPKFDIPCQMVAEACVPAMVLPTAESRIAHVYGNWPFTISQFRMQVCCECGLYSRAGYGKKKDKFRICAGCCLAM